MALLLFRLLRLCIRPAVELIETLMSFFAHILVDAMTSSRNSGNRPGRKNYRCEICGRIFEDSYALSYHKSVEHSPGKRSPAGVT
jgi:hypothetical protein